jgi:cytoskeleton-associated protein 5
MFRPFFFLQKYIFSLDPGVRDSSAEALGTAMKVVGEKVIMPFLPDLEAMKMAKIKECCEKAVVSGKSSGPAKPKTAIVVNDVKETTAKSAEAEKPAGSGVKVEEKVEKELSPEDVEEKAAAILPPDVITGITDANWKTRLGAMESLMQVWFGYQ